MNRYPVWKYAILVIVLLVGALYTLPNFFGEAPAVQVSSAKATIKVDTAVQRRVEEALKAANLSPDFVTLEGASVRARFDTAKKLSDEDSDLVICLARTVLGTFNAAR